MLSQFVVSELFAFLLIFCRMGTAIMLLPGFGEIYVPMRARLFIALLFSILLVPVLHALPPVPATMPALVYIIIAEILVGAFLGGLSRMLIAGMHIAGTIIAFQSSLASAVTVNISGFSGQDTSLGNLLTMSAVVLLFVTDLDHYMLKGLADSYSLFLPGQFPNVTDIANHATQTMSGIFRVAMQLAAPNIAIGLMLYLGAGILSRLMPNMQIFFIMMAPQLLLSFFIMMITLSAIMLFYIDYFKETLAAFLTP